MALRIITSSAGNFQPRMVARITALIEEEVARRSVRPAGRAGDARLRDRAARRGLPLQRCQHAQRRRSPQGRRSGHPRRFHPLNEGVIPMSQPVSPEILSRVEEGFEWWRRWRATAHAGRVRRGRRARSLGSLYGHAGDTRPRGHAPPTGPVLGRLGRRENGRTRGLRDRSQAICGGRAPVGQGQAQRGRGDLKRFACLYTVRDTDNKIVRNQFFPTVQAATEFARTDSTASAQRG